jgi:dienelactone hydrolase
MYCNEAFEALGPVFAKAGWVFFAPRRRGQGLSVDAGPYIGDEIAGSWEKGGPAAADESAARLLQTDHLEDQLAGLAWLRQQAFVDPKRIAVMGDSFGGIETLLGAEKESYCAAVDIAGGAKSWAQAPQLQLIMRKAATHAKSPIFFIQPANDYDLRPSKVLSQAARTVGNIVEVKIYAPFGKSAQEGHSFGYRGTAIWQRDALRFMEQNCKPRSGVH